MKIPTFLHWLHPNNQEEHDRIQAAWASTLREAQRVVEEVEEFTAVERRLLPPVRELPPHDH